ncbi:MAG TPA: S8 family peptidase [Gaiellaceae bacterium]|nr:S8 family peptidase [Gaiellaceae bacterium]
MTQTRHKAIQRWLAAVLTMAVLIAGATSPADARTYDPDKIDPAFLQQVLADPKADYDVLVRGNADATSVKGAGTQTDRAAKAVKNKGGKTKFSLGIIGGGAATLRGNKVLELTRDNDVDYVFKDVPVTAKWSPSADYGKATTPGIVAVNAPQAWQQYNVCGRGVGVAVVDSGVYAHPDLAGRITAAVDFTSGTMTTNTSGDPGGHGTHVAGLVAGDGSRSNGAYTGVAPCANIVDVRVIDATGNSNTGLILRGLQWVLANKHTYNIKVVNMSFGATQSGSYKTDPLATAAQVLTFAGITTVVSAGNSGPTGQTITSPATDPFVISVGALDDNNTASLADDLMATFSSRGRTKYDNLSKPDLVAPGRKMVSLLSPGSTIPTMYPDRLVTAVLGTSTSLLGVVTQVLADKPEYLRLSGTSMAAPVVSGAVALMLERNSTLTPAQVKSRLKKSAKSLSFGSSSDKGAGLLNVLSAVGSVDPSKEYSEGRVTDSFAKDMRKFVQGQPIPWRDALFNGGADSKGITWENVTWENITWDVITWENITWENFTWENITWENVTWENITWQSTDAQSTGALSGTSGFSGLVD